MSKITSTVFTPSLSVPPLPCLSLYNSGPPQFACLLLSLYPVTGERKTHAACLSLAYFIKHGDPSSIHFPANDSFSLHG